MDKAKGEPIAIVGAGLRLPGGVRDLASYWTLLIEGVDAVGRVPADRWDAARYTSADPDAPGKMITDQGGFLGDVATFDPAFFGISPREALEMDPAQRLLLEVAWEALENAALDPSSLKRTPMGVYVGLGLSDYSRRHFGGPDPTRMTPHSGTGSLLSVAAGRISYTLGLTGPAMTVDTACSSSLVSVHLAVAALRRGEVDAALAGGANVLVAPEPSIYFSKLGALAADGRCKTFSDAADGYGRGEGAGLVVLQRLDDALAGGHPILAVIHGTAVNQDGRSNGLTAPSGRAQQEVIRAAWADGGVQARQVGLVEAHGTGTPLGDPIEVEALKAVLGTEREVVHLGSAKTNFGHLETAAGIAGLLKLALCVKHGEVPPHLHLTKVNPRVRLQGSPLEIPRQRTSWEDDVRVGGVSAFGLSGTNAHVVLGPAPDSVVASAPARSPEIVVLSARDAAALSETARDWSSALGEESLPDVAYTALAGRADLQERVAITATTAREAAERLATFARGELPEGAAAGTAPKGGQGVVFLYTGQGAQHLGMARALVQTDPVFRQALSEAIEAMGPLLDRPLTEVMWQDASALDDTRYTQPALFALQVALTQWWAHHGVRPDAVVGHSIGEFAAAVVAEALSLDDAARLVVERGRLMSELPREGAMLAVFASEERVAAVVAPHAADVSIAGVNGPTETVISGRTASIATLEAELKDLEVRTRRLSVSHAFHSALMEPMLDGFFAAVADVPYGRPSLPVYSNVDGTAAGFLADTDYWVQHVRKTVRFADGMRAAFSDGHRLFLEIGPRPVLCGMGQRVASAQAEVQGATFVPSLHPDRLDTEQLAESLGALWAHGASVELAVRSPSGRRLCLPPTRRTGQRLWLEPLAETPRSAPAPLAPDTAYAIGWQRSGVRRGTATGDWVVLGDDAVAAALAERGAEVHREWVDDPVGVVLAPEGTDALDIAWQAVRAVQRLGPGQQLHLVSHTAERPATAVLQGLGRVVALEHPDRWGGLVDVHGGDADAVVDALLAGDGEDAVRLVDGVRHLPRLSAVRRDGEALPVGPGTVWITGGFGAVGAHVARWLADRGVRSLVLTGRSGPASDDAQALVAELQEAGVAVRALAADVGQQSDVELVLAELDEPLLGIVHCAGTNRDAPLSSLSFDDLQAVFDAKVVGTDVLHAATAELDLRFFVLVSSAAAVLGTPGQGNYAAANAYLDAVAAWRRGQGLPATSVAFGPLAGAGMAAAVQPSVRSRWASEGVHLLEPEHALLALARTALGPEPSVLVAPFQWSVLHAARSSPLLRDLASAPAPAPLPEPRSAQSLPAALVSALAAAPSGARPRMALDHVQQLVSRVLGRGPDQPLSPTEGFFDAGMDSVMATELHQRLQRDLGRELPASLPFDFPTVQRLAEQLLVLVDLAPAAEIEQADAPVAADHEPVAIVGAACRFPGGVNDLDALWALLERGGDAITEVPSDRFDIDAVYAAGRGTPGTTYSRHGGFIEGIDQFDPRHFGIPPREAASLDPQQRLLLEVTWHALEHAGIAPRSLTDTRTGVFVGIGQSEYWLRFDPRRPDADKYAGTGNEASFAAGRIAYTLGLQGPAMSVNTACSSSLVSVHLAVRALREGRAQLAVAGGVNAIVGPEHTLWMSLLESLSEDGRCKAFDRSGDGYVRSEGCGMVVLKRLSDARRDGDRVLAVVRGSAVNHDGASAGITVPNGPAQQQVIRAALQDASVQPHEVGFVECHGTGTTRGDPVEIGALGQVLATDRAQPLLLGAVKTNLGHLEAAAGIAGLLKAVLCLQRGAVPSIVHLRDVNPALPLQRFPALTLPTELTPWPGEGARVAGVSSFGISGTNAHVVLQQAEPAAEPERATERPALLITWSSRTPAGLAEQAEALAAVLQGDVPLADVAYTQNVGRSGGRVRGVVVAADRAGAIAGLRAADVSDRPLPKGDVVFLCTGAGPQEPGMAKALYDADPVFRQALDEAAAAADEVLDTPLLEVLFAKEGERPELHDLAYTQPAMFAVQWAMAALWADFGVTPAALIGHSTGQVIAACLAGVLDLHDGMRLMAARARLMTSLPRNGAMVAARTSERAVLEVLAERDPEGEHVSIAAVNSPGDCVFSGRSEVVQAVADQLEAQGVDVRRLKISHAAHSPLMEPILDEYEAMVARTTFAAPQIPLAENVYGGMATAEQLQDPAYWRDHMRQAVRFGEGIRTLLDAGHRTFVELGNHPVLSSAAERVAQAEPEARFIPSLRRNQPDWPTLLEAVGRVWARGGGVDFRRFHARQPGAVVALPGTLFQRERYWVDRPAEQLEPVVDVAPIYAGHWAPLAINVEARGGQGSEPLLVLGEAGGLGRQLVDRQQRPSVLADPGAEVQALIADVAPTDVVFLEPLQVSREGDAIEAVHAVAERLLQLLQAASRQGCTVWVVTDGRLTAAAIDGLCTVAAVELDVPLVRLQLDAAAPEDASLQMLQLVLNTGLSEGQLAIVDGQPRIRRFGRWQPPSLPPTESARRREGTALVTGGLGALGLHLARWLADRGAASIVLTSRSEPSEAAAAVVAELHARDGVRCQVLRADVADAGGVRDLVAGIDAAGLPAVSELFHAAGVLRDASLLSASAADFEPVWRPKVRGVELLLQAMPDLDRLVLFSSAASMLGSAGQAVYAAANAYLAARARTRRAEGLHALSVGWGPWAEGGLAAESTRAWQAQGITPLAPARALAALDALLTSDLATAAVVDLDWSVWPDTLVRVPAVVAELVPRDAEADDVPAGLAKVLRLGSAERQRAITEIVTHAAARILGVAPSEVHLDTGFADLGMDSLMSVELARRLRRELHPPLPVSVAFDHPTVRALTAHLGEVVAPAAATELSAPPILPSSSDEPIAIVGVSCRMPGGANDPEAFWELLHSGTDPMEQVPASRWDLSAVYDEVPGTPGRMYTREAGFVDFDVVEGFDPEFFGISPKEAASLDPQQRMLLEVGYEAIERARIPIGSLRASPTGVYVGVGDSGYLQRFQGAGEPLYADAYAGTGSLEAFVSGRLAYHLGLHGPNLALNTACSSSLVAVHLAVQALRSGECSLALAGGVHLMLSPENFVYVSQIKAVAPDGRCKTFDARADGYGRAEGCGMVVLERLSDAQRHGHPVLAVIRGSAVGHDGASQGLTVPNGTAQVQVVREALSRSGVQPAQVSYIEAHGTGTVLGDPIEVHALQQVYGAGRTADNPLHLGAVKSNVGHLEVAAGAASLVKMVLALQHRRVPPHLHLQTVNPELDLAAGHMVVDTEPAPWSAPDGVLRAGVSAFGLAGTNVHLLLEQAPDSPVETQQTAVATERPLHVLPLSARSEGSLRMLAARVGAQLQAGVDLPDLAWSAATTRTAHPHRVAVVAADGAEAAERLATFVASGAAPLASTGRAGRQVRLAFLFAGQGSQYPGMGQELYALFPAYRDALDRCAAVLDPLLPRPLLEVVHAAEGDETVHDTTFTQPALVAHELALAALWRSWGLEPELVGGHSVGQIAAAIFAGVFSLEDGLALVAERGRLMGALAEGGAMAAVFADEATVQRQLANHSELAIAAVNHPGEVVISGPAAAVQAARDAFAAAEVEVRPLVVSHAFHSALMEPALDDFERAVAGVQRHAPRVDVLCNASGEVARAEDLQRPGYWRDLARQPVRFADDVRAAVARGIDTFVAVGPHPSVLAQGRRTHEEPHLGWFPSLRRGKRALPTLLSSVAGLWARGAAIDFAAFDAPWPRSPVDLPTYPWQRVRCWIDKPEWPAVVSPGRDWFHVVDWQQAEPPAPVEELGAWRVVGEGPVATALSAALRDGGAEVAQATDASDVQPGESVAFVARGGLGPADAAAEAFALTSAAAAMVATEAPGALHLLTTSATPAPGTVALDAAQAALWGVLRVARMEHPELQLVGLDLDPSDPGAPGDWVAALHDRQEPEQALRSQERWVPRLRALPAPTGTQGVRGDGVYLITGGLRGLGLQVASAYAEAGAGHLVLLGRSAPEAATEQQLEAWREGGTGVSVVRGSVSEAADVQRAVAAAKEAGALRGVVHAAGVLDDAALVRQTAAGFERVFAPKVLGTEHVLQAVGDGLDHVVLFSGGASLLGSPGQANYAAANAYLDAVAHRARAAGVPVLAVNWGAWAEVGMAARLGSGHAERQAREGIGRIPVDQGLQALMRLLGSGHPQVGVLPVDWDRLVATVHRGRRPAFLEHVARSVAAPPVAATAPSAPAVPAGGWTPDRIAQIVHDRAVAVLQFEASRKLDRSRPLLEMGLDSLLAMELKNALTDAGIDLPIARVMTGPSIDELTQVALNAVEAPAPAGPVQEGPVGAAPPVNPIASHFFALVLGAVLSVGLYMATLRVSGPSKQLQIDPAAAEAAAVIDDAPKAKAKRPGSKVKTKTKTKSKARAKPPAGP
ncbi:MAG: SDR family NAD(P)-dependent oxidoreductase [Myxococcales bacterium]|nr:SDR family NAD(P)-dependent oxidoreductase [Myxococcales bacterium]